MTDCLVRKFTIIALLCTQSFGLVYFNQVNLFLVAVVIGALSSGYQGNGKKSAGVKEVKVMWYILMVNNTIN